jgi:uncharacterized protein YecT (DUF1311 family)
MILVLHLFKWVLFFMLVLTSTVLVSHSVVAAFTIGKEKSLSLYDQMMSSLIEIKEIERFVPVGQKPLERIIDEAAKEFSLPPVAIKATIMQESAGKYFYRFEPHVFNRLKEPHEQERRMLASSHGYMHILGTTAQAECGLKWHELYDTELNIACGAKYLAKQYHKHSKVKDKSERLWMAFRDYNGTGDAAARHADKVMGHVGKILLNEGLR